MAQHSLVYTVIHQPRRLRLPAQPIPPGAGAADIARCLFDVDLRRFIERMQWMREELARLFGKTPDVTDTTEMFMANDIYFALQQAGFAGAVMDGREWVMQWREPSHLYEYQGRPALFC